MSMPTPPLLAVEYEQGFHPGPGRAAVRRHPVDAGDIRVAKENEASGSAKSFRETGSGTSAQKRRRIS